MLDAAPHRLKGRAVLQELALTVLWLSLIIAARYLVLAGGAYWLFWGAAGAGARSAPRRLSREPPRRAAVRHEIIASLISTPIYALPAAAALVGFEHGYTRLYADPAAYGYWWLPVSAVIYLLAHDAFYYWLHRLLHHRAMFKWAHRGHHRSRDPTPFASFAFDPAEAALTAWFLPALTLIIPLQIGLALGLLLLMTLTAVLNHAGHEIWPERWLRGPLARLLITASHHDVHHKHFLSNYGLYFRFWDKLGGTDKDA